ncbi:ABC transporter permease [Larkinella knui]|uniref:FtsX-like permease family protein n=1 Tax=Larkinella knui TaxID=2025310 RepID=A0A3P1CHD2_9BACT|nr:ABC transporter permease [Larkinella knui]RRB12660.1 FtsX-like permease family protein [Larkinella knui]
MLQNYFKIAWRNLLKYKLFSFINILGLSLAIPTALMGLVQIVNYYEFDNFHEDEERIVRLITDEKRKDGDIINWASSPVPLASYIREHAVGIEKSATIVRDLSWVLSNGIKTKNSNAIYTNEAFFQLFKFPLEKGTYPIDPNTMVLTHETARWFFGDTNPIGNILEHPTLGSFKIVGVLKPFNSLRTQFRTDVFVPLTTYLTSKNPVNDWSALNAHTFLKLAKGMTPADLDRQLSITDREINHLLTTTAPATLHFKAQYLADISPAKAILKNDPYIQDIRSMYVNFAFQLIILVLASLNYINLTLARSMNRSREVGVRKVAGATKSQLVLQFLVESVLISYIALGVGLLLLGWIKNQIQLSWLTWDIDHLGYLILLFFVFNLILGLAAGAAPSFILSAYQPVKVLKGTIAPTGFGKIGFRKSLIIVQFTIALVYIFFIGHLYHQVDYMATDNENYHRKDILNLNIAGNQYKTFAADVRTIKEVEKIGYTSLMFGNKPTQAGIKKVKNEVSNPAFYYAVDHQFVENMGLRIVAGKNLIPSNADLPSPLILVNQKAVEKLNLGSEQEAIGKLIVLNDTISATIIGVVANFCHYDYESKIEPVVFQYRPALFKVMCLKTSPVRDRRGFEATLRSQWMKYTPHQEMNALWLDTDMYERYYPYNEMQFMNIEGVAIFVIAILGLIGILTYSLEKRTKEIGIRKVIGATTVEIIRMISTEFIKLLAIAITIAIPLGIIIGRYMNSFYVFNQGIGYLTMSGLVAVILGIALMAVGFFSWQAAQANPARTLKAE